MSSDAALTGAPATANVGDRILQIADRLTDRLNPILVKEMRQALKSRQFVFTFMLLLVVAWLVSAGTAVFAPTAMEFGSAGNSLFLTYFGILAFAVFVIVPFGAYRSMLAERDQNTYELLSISALTPRQIVNGKLLSAMVQSFVYYSAITPFVAFSSLLQGFDLPLSLFLLVAAFGWSICASMFTLMLSTLVRKRQIQAANSLGMFFRLMFQLYMTGGLLLRVVMSGVPFDDPEFWWTVGCVVVGAGSYALLAQQIAVSRLTFDSGNRSSGIRVILAAQFWVFCGAVLGYSLWSGFRLSGSDIAAPLVIAAVHWTVSGLMASTEPDWLSRRLRRQLPRSAVLRLLMAPWLPGGARGFLWMLIHVLLILAAVLLLGRNMAWLPTYATGLFCYVVFVTGTGAALTRWLGTAVSVFRPAHGRTLTFLLAVGMFVLPLVARAFGRHPISYAFIWTDLPSPFVTLPYLFDHGTPALATSEIRNRILAVLIVFAVLAVLVNVRAMYQGVKEVVRQNPGPKLTDPGAD